MVVLGQDIPHVLHSLTAQLFHMWEYIFLPLHVFSQGRLCTVFQYHHNIPVSTGIVQREDFGAKEVPDLFEFTQECVTQDGELDPGLKLPLSQT